MDFKSLKVTGEGAKNLPDWLRDESNCSLLRRRSIRIEDEQKSKIRSFAVKPYMMLEPTSLITKLQSVVEWHNVDNNNFRDELIAKSIKELEEKDTSEDRKSYKQIKASERWLENKYQELNYKMGSSSKYNEEVAKEYDVTDIMLECVKHYAPSETQEEKINYACEQILLQNNISVELASALAYQKIRVLDDYCEKLFNAITDIKNILYIHKDLVSSLSFPFKEEIDNLKIVISKSSKKKLLLNCK